MSDPPSGARSAPSALRNRGPILEALRPWLPASGEVLEIASGSGEHAVFMAEALPNLAWRPTDRDPEALASMAASRTCWSRCGWTPPSRSTGR